MGQAQWQALIDQLPQNERTIRLHPTLHEDLIHALAKESSEQTTPSATDEAPSETPAVTTGQQSQSNTEDQGTVEDEASSFLEGFSAEGLLLSTALIRQKVLPDMALNMLAIGEETGEMDKMLSKGADFYEDEVGAMVKALTSMLEPAMIVVVVAIVGSILLAM